MFGLRNSLGHVYHVTRTDVTLGTTPHLIISIYLMTFVEYHFKCEKKEYSVYVIIL